MTRPKPMPSILIFLFESLIEPNNLNEISKIILKLDDKSRAEEIRNIRSQTVFNIGKSASVGAEYIEKILNS